MRSIAESELPYSKTRPQVESTCPSNDDPTSVLNANDQRLKYVLEAAMDGIWDWDISTGQVYYSPQWARLLGYSPEEVQYSVEFFFQVLHPEDATRIKAALDIHFAGLTEVKSQEVRLKSRNGTYRWFLDRGKVVSRDADGKPLRMVGTITDIDELKRAEDRVRQVTERLELAVAGTADGLFDRDLKSNYEYFSPRYKELLGYSDDDPDFPHTWDSFKCRLHPDDVASTMQSIQTAVERNVPYNAVYRLRCKDGSWKWFEARGKTLCGEDGKAIRMAGAITDITKRRQVELDLQAANRMLEEAQSIARSGNWRIDPVTFEIQVSKFTYRLLARHPDEGSPTYAQILAQFLPESANLLDRSVRKAATLGDPFSLVLRSAFPTCEVQHLRCEGRARRDEFGAIIEVFGTITDITREVDREDELTLARQEAEAASHVKTQFLANMSHEIRTPLTAILGFSELLRDPNSCDSQEKRNQLLDTITSAGNHLLTVINDILDISKIEAEKVHIERIDMSIRDILQQVMKFVAPTAEAKGIPLEVHFASDVPDRILGDPTRLRQILMNLVNNATNFTAQGRIRIEIAAQTQTNDATMERIFFDVIDSGPGIPNEQIANLFQPFVQADNSVTRKYGGTGLGLAISRRLARLMEGDVDLIWSRPNVGSCFRCTLPFQRVRDSVASESLSDSKLLGEPTSVPQRSSFTLESNRLRGRILLAEDGVDNQRLIAFFLTKAGAEVAIAENGEIAMRMLNAAKEANRPFDLLLTDIQMPVMDGYTLTKALRSAKNDIPVVALTAHALPEDKQRCLDAGCNGYSSKPIDRANLIATCARFLS